MIVVLFLHWAGFGGRSRPRAKGGDPVFCCLPCWLFFFCDSFLLFTQNKGGAQAPPLDLPLDFMWVFSPQGIPVYFTIIFHYLGSSFIKPWYCIINGYSPSNLKTIRPGCQGFLCSSIITRTQFDHMTSSKVVFSVQWGKVTWPMTVEYQMQMSKLKKSTDKLSLMKILCQGFFSHIRTVCLSTHWRQYTYI